MFTTIVSALALRLFGCFMTVATEETYCVARGSVAGIRTVLVSAMRSVGAFFAHTLAGATVIAASAIRFFGVAGAIVVRLAAFVAAPPTANTLATATSSALTIIIGGRVVRPIVDSRAANPFGKIVDPAAVRVPSRVIDIVAIIGFVESRAAKFGNTTGRRDILFVVSRAFVVGYAVCITYRRHIIRETERGA